MKMGNGFLSCTVIKALFVTNTLFEGNIMWKAFERHPRSKHWHHLDLILTRTKYSILDLFTVPTATMTMFWCAARQNCFRRKLMCKGSSKNETEHYKDEILRFTCGFQQKMQ